MDFLSIKTLELDKILLSVSKFARSEECGRILLAGKSDYSYENALSLLDMTGEAVRVLSFHIQNPMSDYSYLKDELTKAKKLSTLGTLELLDVARLMRAIRIFATTIKQIEDDGLINLKALADDMRFDRRLEDRITSAIIGENEISDTASFELKNIRQNIVRCNQDIKDKLQSIVKSNNYQKFLQDSIVTLRNGRYVVPVKSEYRQSIPGLVHDQSQSRATLFIEPMQVVELNNKLRTLELDEKAEIERILGELTQGVSFIAEELLASQDNLVSADEIFAKAEYALSIRAVKPELSREGIVDLKRARHPLLKRDIVVPIDIRIGGDFDILIITGPNTGGKTVSIKTVGLLCLMAMNGMFIPCSEGSKVSYFENIFCDIGDNQSIEDSLSTFSSHITKIRDICEYATDNSLVLLDEIGGGTDPEEGAALAKSIVEYLLKKGCKLITTTHYAKLKELTNENGRVQNASMDFDFLKLSPTYKLTIGLTGNSKALEIASKLGMKPEIIESAKENLSPEKRKIDEILNMADRLIAENTARERELADMKKQLGIELLEVKKEREQTQAKLKRLTENATKETKRLVSENVSEADELLMQIKDIAKKTNLTTFDIVKGGELKKKLEREYNIIEQNLEVKEEKKKPQTFKFNAETAKKGDKVFVKSLGSEGMVLSPVKRGKLLISIGSMTMNIDANDLLGMEGEKFKQEVVVNKNAQSIRNAAVKSEINLLGQNSYDAEINAEKFLEEAAQGGLSEVRIIHGKGTGILRNAVHALLKNSKLVASYRLGIFGEGESGVTIVTLK